MKKEIIDKLKEHDWPGNIRELEKWIQRLTRRYAGGELSLKDLPKRFISSIMRDEDSDYNLPHLPLPFSLDEYVEKIRENARHKAAGSMAEVDRLLSQSPGTEKQRQYRKKTKRS